MPPGVQLPRNIGFVVRIKDPIYIQASFNKIRYISSRTEQPLLHGTQVLSHAMKDPARTLKQALPKRNQPHHGELQGSIASAFGFPLSPSLHRDFQQQWRDSAQGKQKQHSTSRCVQWSGLQARLFPELIQSAQATTTGICTTLCCSDIWPRKYSNY